jgi:hypothetical protein
MSTATPEQRVYARSQFFLVQADGEIVSFYSFRPENAKDAIPALVVDLSDGGVQILSATSMPLTNPKYLLELVTDKSQPSDTTLPVHLVWTRPDGINTRSGFAFEANPDRMQGLRGLMEDSEHRILRCVLFPHHD